MFRIGSHVLQYSFIHGQIDVYFCLVCNVFETNCFWKRVFCTTVIQSYTVYYDVCIIYYILLSCFSLYRTTVKPTSV